MRRCLNLVVVVAAVSMSAPALASPPECPAGSWFCADAEVTIPAPARPQAPRIPPQAVPAPAEEPEAPMPPPPVRRRQAPPMPPGVAPPPVVIYQPVPLAPPTQVIVVTPGYGYGYGGYGPYARPRPPTIAAPPAPRWRSEFGINLRVEGMPINKPGAGVFNAGLGGVGLSLRYRPVPHFAFDLGVDVLAGTDYNGFQRTEVPISLSGMLFVNPRSRVQFYLLGGGTVSRAQVRSDLNAPQLHPVEGGTQYGDTFTYVGGQGGGGFEFRLSRRVALDLDGIGFIRKRIDDSGKPPEFTDPQSGKSTNVSGGALVRGGLTFWW